MPSPASAAPAPPPTSSPRRTRSSSPAPTRPFLGQIADVLRVARFDVQRTTDVTGVELAGAARNAAVLAAAAAAPAGASAADAAADMVLAEVDAYARRQGGHPESFADLAGAGDSAQALDDLPLLAVALREDGIDAPRRAPAWPTSSPAASSPSAGPPP